MESLSPALASAVDAVRQNHSRSYNRPKQRAASDLIDAGDHAIAAVPQRLLWRVAAHKLAQHLLLGCRLGDRLANARSVAGEAIAVWQKFITFRTEENHGG